MVMNDAAVFDAGMKVAFDEAAVRTRRNVDSGFAIVIDWRERTVIGVKSGTPIDLDLALKKDMFRRGGYVAQCDNINRCGYQISKGTGNGAGRDSASAICAIIDRGKSIRLIIRDFEFSSQRLGRAGKWFRLMHQSKISNFFYEPFHLE
jgi:hypothetical protein